MAILIKAVEGTFFKKNVLKETRDDIKIYIASAYKEGTRDILRGLSTKEEEKYLPHIIGVKPGSESWDSTVKDYWANYQFRVPLSGGLRLNNKLNEEGEPENLDDYIKYRFALESNKVAVTEEERENPSRFIAVMEDEEETLKRELLDFKTEVEADKLYIKIISDDDKEKKKHIFYMLRNAEDGSPSIVGDMLDYQLKKIKDRDLHGFISVANDPDLSMKVLIKLGIERNILERSGNSIYYMNELVGDSEREAILYLENVANTKTLGAIKQSIKKPK